MTPDIGKPKLLTRTTFEVPCTIEVSHTHESLHAHVQLDGGIKINPGDEVVVEGSEVKVPFGEVQTFRRKARVTRASKIESLWTRATGDIEFMELCEFSFSERAAL